MLSSKICVFSAICESDNVWVDQYLAEMERLQLPFVIYLDRCSQETKDRFNHPNCIGRVEQDKDIEFTESAKQSVFDLIPKTFTWALALDVDEIFETNADFSALDESVDYVECIWVNMWGDKEHLRIDGVCQPKPRLKFYNLKNKWRFLYKTVNGAYAVEKEETTKQNIELVCLHAGLMTKELRDIHKERWDRIYGQAIGKNPYGFWDFVLDESIEPIIIKNKYLW